MVDGGVVLLLCSWGWLSSHGVKAAEEEVHRICLLARFFLILFYAWMDGPKAGFSPPLFLVALLFPFFFFPFFWVVLSFN